MGGVLGICHTTIIITRTTFLLNGRDFSFSKLLACIKKKFKIFRAFGVCAVHTNHNIYIHYHYKISDGHHHHYTT